MSCSVLVQPVVVRFLSAAGAFSDRVGPSVGKRWRPVLTAVGRYALKFLRVPGVTYSRATVVSVVFQVRLDVCSSGNGRCSLSLWGIGPLVRLLCVVVPCSVLSPFSLGCRGWVRHGSQAALSRSFVSWNLCRGDWRRVVTLCPVLKHGPRSARDAQVGRVVLGLFPRELSCLKDPCVWNRRSESNSWVREPLGDQWRIAGRAKVTLWPVSSTSVSVATRKMVNYA